MKTLRRIYMALMLIFLYSPLVVMVFFSFNSGDNTFVFKGFSTKWYQELFVNGSGFIDPLLNTLTIALLSSIIATVIGTVAAYGIFKLRTKIVKSAIMTVTNIPMMNPDIVTGISLMLLFVFVGKLFNLTNSVGFVTILIAHITFNLPYVILSVLPKFKQMDSFLPEAALDLGCTPFKTFMKVTFPCISSGIITGFIMAFTLSLDDFVISYFTSGHYQTLPILIYTMVKKPLKPTVYSLYTIILVVVFIMLIFYNVFQSNDGKLSKKSGGAAKKTVSIVLIVALIVGCCFGLSKCKSSFVSKIDTSLLHREYSTELTGTTLYVYNWGEYISDGSDDSIDVIKEFENLTGIHVEYITYDSNESMYSTLKSGSVAYDIIIPSDYMISRLKDENMLYKIDTSLLSNYHLIDDKYKGMYYDENNEYSVPYNVGLVGLIYNQTMVDEVPDSWSYMFDEKYQGQILTFDNPRDAFMIAQFYLGYDINDTDKSKWNDASELLIKQKNVLKMYVMDQVFNMMETGDAAIAPYYAGDFVTMLESNPDLRFVYPKEGTNIFVDAACIPKNAQNVEAAMMFIDFLLEPQIAQANADYICYASPNTAVSEDEEYLSSLVMEFEDGTEFDYSSILYPSDDELPICEYYHNLDDDTQRYYDELWTKIKLS